ncbi:hypothetical protein [Pseudonocardia abyssalis]|uniref:hypothetical protein n=1 Tax=Pseudonocardia abyssalis TaxID=2792008 RepID=UPI001C49EED0|nr:hypothetical protein [Pseudonocardia abyssalis]
MNAVAPPAATSMAEGIRSNEKPAAKTLERIPLGRARGDRGDVRVPRLRRGVSISGQVLPVDGGTVIQ